ncbi:ATP-sensitive inward rectifier potassium channel 1-like isoform X2 [Mercenaria mercenaria]|uniref:ATP-sensitive inward rectifier potassium channel 1-like isoform X2 n=1 Tax=Mercenaria mercenaria TaxID=6596 RepID=UPI00234EBD79|nr:ATP-sensitive inward rectifier potassium channel 1-like isoform X2 [Mercenaria mercenaria]
MGWSQLKKDILRFLPWNWRTLRRKSDIDESNASRIINREGKVKIVLDQLSFGKRRRYWRNPLPSLLSLQWRWIMVIFAFGFILTWLLFAIVYYMIAKLHGDFEPNDNPDFDPCMNSVNSFTAAFLFSLETQHTIGYGSRNPTSECSEAVVTVYVQFIIGVAVQCVTAGLVVAKLQLGKRTSKAITFSKKAIVGKCNDNVCLMVRIGNAGVSELVNARGFGILMERKKVSAGEEILNESFLTFVSENGSENLNLLWPMVIHCQVLENQEEFLKKIQSPQCELIVIVEGILASTGQTMQLRMSYLAHEIDIGQQFVDISPVLMKNKTGNKYHHLVDYKDFDVTEVDEQWDESVWLHDF